MLNVLLPQKKRQGWPMQIRKYVYAININLVQLLVMLLQDTDDWPTQTVAIDSEPGSFKHAASDNGRDHGPAANDSKPLTDSVDDANAAVVSSDAQKMDIMSPTENFRNQENSSQSRRPATFKPVSFAKYSAVKAIGNNALSKISGEKRAYSAFKHSYLADRF